MSIAPPPKSTGEVISLPGAPARTIEGKLFSELSEFEQEVEVIRRRLRRWINT